MRNSFLCMNKGCRALKSLVLVKKNSKLAQNFFEPRAEDLRNYIFLKPLKNKCRKVQYILIFGKKIYFLHFPPLISNNFSNLPCNPTVAVSSSGKTVFTVAIFWGATLSNLVKKERVYGASPSNNIIFNWPYICKVVCSILNSTI